MVLCFHNITEALRNYLQKEMEKEVRIRGSYRGVHFNSV